MRLERRVVDDVVIVTVTETTSIDNTNRERFFDNMSLIFNERPRVVLDLSRIEHMTSAAIGTLVALFRNASDGDGALKLLHLHEKLIELFEMTHLDTLFEIYPNEAEAVASFKK